MEKFTFILLVLLPMALGQVHDQCIPDCKPGDVAPNKGGPACSCTSKTPLPGCQVSACKSGENSAEEYTCMCTKDNQQTGCVKPRCTNGTEDGAATAESTTASAGAGVFGCNNLCKCGKQPPECTATSVDPINGGPPCTCTVKNWLTGCTMRPCRKGDTHDNIDWWFCECTKDYAPDFCYTPQCRSLLG